MKMKIRKRTLKFGAEALAITALTIAAIVILNVAFTALAYRYLWYGDMSANLEYAISEDCEDYIENNKNQKIDPVINDFLNKIQKEIVVRSLERGR